MKRYFIMLCMAALSASVLAQTVKSLSSPDGNIRVDVSIDKGITYDVFCGNEQVLSDCRLSMDIEGNVLGSLPKLQSVKRQKVNDVKRPFLKLKFAEVPNNYNEMTLVMKGNYSVVFRAYNDGMAYRFVTSLKGEVEVNHEDITVFFPEDAQLVLQQSDRYRSSYEERYSFVKSSEWLSFNKMAHYPVLAITSGGTKILMSESDLCDYPAPFFRSNDANGFSSVFPRVPAIEKPRTDKSTDILLRKPYIAKTQGTRSFPWRYFVIAKDEAALLTNTMTCRLAQDSKLEDVSWIHPGQASWEWWNGAIPYGPEVNFKAGLNVETYKYFMDFASKYGIPYIVMDEGWAKDNMDAFTANPACDLMEIIAHGKKVGVDVILWLTWRCVEENPGLFAQFEKWGVKGVKIDFMDHANQWMVNFYKRVMDEAAKHKLLVDMHGSFTPAGLEYEYPNMISYEGVLGLEQMGGCVPDNTTYLPYIRNAVGAADFTPGGMNNRQSNNYQGSRPNSSAHGTRAFQMALYVVLESGLQMLADNPTEYYKNDDCTRFIASVPTTWDETRALVTNVGKYTIVAKRKGKKWFIGGICEGFEKERTFDLKLDFLGDGEYKMTAFKDGVNANYQAMHYNKVEQKVNKNTTIKVTMMMNGGFAAVIE